MGRCGTFGLILDDDLPFISSRPRFNRAVNEFWSDKVKPDRKQVDEFVNPILEERQKQHLAMAASEKAGDDEEGETFLDHLIKFTEGWW